MGRYGFVVLALGATAAAAQQDPAMTRVCLAPSSVEAGSSNANAAMDATRENFVSFLTGPSLKAEPLKARLEAQVREEAKQAECPYVLYTTVKLVSKRSGSSVLGHATAAAVREGAYAAGVATGSTAGRVAGSAVSSAAHHAAYNYAATIRNKDELTIGYRLEDGAGKVLLDKKEKRSAKADGEDVLTPLIQKASEEVYAATRGGQQ